MLKFLEIALRNVFKNKTRSLILGSAIVLISIVLTMLMAITSGIENTMLKSSTTLLTGHINIAGFYKISMSSAAPVITDLSSLDNIAKETVKDAVLIIDRVKGWGKVISDTGSVQAPMWGIDITTEADMKKTLKLAKKTDYIENYKPQPGESLYEGNFEDMEKTGNIALFAVHAKKLKVRVGDTVTISMPTYRNMNNTKDLKVVAVLNDIGFLSQFSIFLHKKDLREIYQMNDDSSGQIMIYRKSVKDVPAVENKLRKVLAEKGYRLMEKESKAFWMKFETVAAETWTGQKIDVTTWTDEISFMEWIIKVFHIVSIVFTLIVLSIVVLGITNAIWISVKERTSEIGTLRAIGMQKSSIITLFVLEGFTLSTISSITGIILGVVLSLFLNWVQIPIYSEAFKHFLLNDYLVFTVKYTNVLVSFFIITIFTTSGAIYPAYKASKMRPVTAMNSIK